MQPRIRQHIWGLTIKLLWNVSTEYKVGSKKQENAPCCLPFSGQWQSRVHPDMLILMLLQFCVPFFLLLIEESKSYAKKRC